jgi:hypothetical protein
MDALTAELFRDLSQDGLSKLADANTEVVDVVTHLKPLSALDAN